MNERIVDTKGKSPKQGLLSAMDQTMQLLEGYECSYTID